MRLVALALCIAAFAAPGAAAQGNRWERQVRDQLQRTAATLAGQGRTELSHVGTLDAEENGSFTVALQGGVSYVMIGVCDQDCAALQLVLSTPANNEITAERRGENFPVLRFTPRETASYRVKVTMAACQMNPCWYGLGVYRE
jgi:hypothetical protein